MSCFVPQTSFFHIHIMPSPSPSHPACHSSISILIVFHCVIETCRINIALYYFSHPIVNIPTLPRHSLLILPRITACIPSSVVPRHAFTLLLVLLRIHCFPSPTILIWPYCSWSPVYLLRWDYGWDWYCRILPLLPQRQQSHVMPSPSSSCSVSTVFLLSCYCISLGYGGR